MKIMFLTTEQSDARGGSAYDKAFIEAINSSVHKIDVITDYDFSETRLSRQFYNKQYKLHADRFAEYDVIISNSRMYTRFSGVIKRIRKFNPEVYIIVFHHHFNFMSHTGAMRLVHRYLELNVLNNVDEIIYASPYVYKIADKYIKRKVNKTLVTSGIKEPPFHAPFVERKKQLVFVGVVEKRKGLIYLLKALKKLNRRDFKTIIVGDNTSSYGEHMMQFAKKYGLEQTVKFVGKIDENEKYKIMYESQAFVFPSLLEGFGLVLLEAMSCGLPVLAFNTSAMPLTVKHNQNGLLAKNRNVKELARNISEILDNDVLRNALSQGAYETFNAAVKQKEVAENAKQYGIELVKKFDKAESQAVK